MVMPLIALGTFIAIRSLRPRAIMPIATASVAAIITALVFTKLNITFTATPANIIFFSIAYLAYCFLAAACWQIRLLPIRIFVLIVAAVPIGVGYMIGTLGFFSIPWFLVDGYRQPTKTVQMTKDLTCSVSRWADGMPAKDFGYRVQLYKQWSVLPFFEREVSSIDVNENESESVSPRVSCTDVLTAYVENHRR